VDDLPCDAASVRRRSIAVILLRGIRRCVAEDRDLNAGRERTSNNDGPVLGNLGDSLARAERGVEYDSIGEKYRKENGR
jgi:hypothetical protein